MVKAAFQTELRVLKTSCLVPLKELAPAYRKTDIYRRVAASIEHVGIIEPLVVFPTANATYVLLDGHTRFDILKERGIESVNCLLSTDNESYTYNKRVNYIPPIAQHYMILRALDHVSEERIAQALNVSVAAIREKRDLLNGICTEAAELLRNERVSAQAFQVLRRMKPVRQVDAAKLMIAAHKFSGRFARAILDGTRDELLVTPPKRLTAAPPEKSIIERETEEMLRSVDTIRANYGNDVLDLTASCRYVERLLANARVHRYLTRHHADALEALQELVRDTQSERPSRRVPEPARRKPTARATAAG